MSYRRSPTCRYCYTRGHTRRSCPTLIAAATAAAAKPAGERDYRDARAIELQSRNVRTAAAPRLCSYCGFEGHNRKGCKSLKGDIERYNALNARWWRGLRAALNSPACKSKIGAFVTWRTWDGFVFHAIVTGLGNQMNSRVHVMQGLEGGDITRWFLSATLISSTVPMDDRRSWMPKEGDTLNIAGIDDNVLPIGDCRNLTQLVSDGACGIDIPEDWGTTDCSHLFEPAKSKRQTNYFSNGRPDFDAIEQFLKNYNI